MLQKFISEFYANACSNYFSVNAQGGGGLGLDVSRPSQDVLGLVLDKMLNVSVPELCVSGLRSVSAIRSRAHSR